MLRMRICCCPLQLRQYWVMPYRRLLKPLSMNGQA